MILLPSSLSLSELFGVGIGAPLWSCIERTLGGGSASVLHNQKLTL